MPTIQQMGPTVARFLYRVDRRAADECWPWIGPIDKSGYGYLQSDVRGKKVKAHRVAYEIEHGPIPQGYRIDHTCHNGTGCPPQWACPHRRCVNPAHLEAVTHRTNLLRGLAPEGTDPDLRVTHCKNRHPRTPENTYTYPSGRHACRICRAERKRERRGMGFRD